MRAYSQDLRGRVIRGRAKNESAAELAVRYKIGKRTVESWWKRYEETGVESALKMGGYRYARLEGQDDFLREWIGKENGLTLVQIQARCLEELGIKVSMGALWERLDKLGLSYKKNAARLRARSARHQGGPRSLGKGAKGVGRHKTGLH